MPEGKLTKKQRAELERLRLEREANEQGVLMAEETSFRERQELLESLERSNCYLRLREGQVALMIDRRAYNDLLRKIDEAADCHAKVLKELEAELHLTQQTKAKLERELIDIRADHKVMMKSLPTQVKTLERNMLAALHKVIDGMEYSREVESKTVMQNFNLQFGRNKHVYLDMLYEMQNRLGHFSEVLVESKSMHSNLPQRLRRQLENCSKEELLFMMDTLSFEDTVLDYFEKKFPRNQPQRWSPSAASPTVALLVAESETAMQAAEELSVP